MLWLYFGKNVKSLFGCKIINLARYTHYHFIFLGIDGLKYPKSPLFYLTNSFFLCKKLGVGLFLYSKNPPHFIFKKLSIR